LAAITRESAKERLAKTSFVRDTRFMATAPDTIEEKVLNWPAARRIKLAEKLMASVEDFATPEIEAAWNTEIESRVTEIRAGRAEGIPAEEVMKEARKKLHEARRLSPVGRRRTH
jgi:putative addiction module component (TIGR02574 family)